MAFITFTIYLEIHQEGKYLKANSYFYDSICVILVINDLTSSSFWNIKPRPQFAHNLVRSTQMLVKIYNTKH